MSATSLVKAWLLPFPVLLGVLVTIRAEGPLREPEDRIIHYNESEGLADPIALLQQQLAAGRQKLEFEPSHGYLASLLHLLEVPASSQSLVFSKTTVPANWIGPKTPRAIYFNDRVSVSWAGGADFIDISSVDPQRGPIFYTLDQRAHDSPRFARDNQCFRCHMGPKTLNVPGLLIRSVTTAPDGYPLSEVDGFTIGHASPFPFRWGGWYVTSADAAFAHLGKVPDAHQGLDASRYLSPGSDIVALLAFAHQAKMQNLITRANYEVRFALAQPGATAESKQQAIAQFTEPLLAYMLFRDEAPLPAPVRGSSSFAEDFESAGPRDSKGRSLRQFDLKTRLMRYPCSYMIYTEAFDSLPSESKSYLWRRLDEILAGSEKGGRYPAMSRDDRDAVREILLETKPEFAAWMKRRSS